MMGTKARLFTPITAVSLEELVPANHFYRHLDRVVDLSFVRDLVKKTYAHAGRPEVDPLLWNPETFGLTHRLFISKRTDIAE